MLLNTDYIYPAELTGYVREALQDFNLNQFTLSSFLPNDHVDDMEYRLLAGGTGLADAASFRSYDAESPIGRRQTLSRLIGELPPISQKVRCGEYDRLRSRKVTDARVADQLFNDAKVVTRAIAARMELARGDALVNGKVTISENGLGVTVDYGRSASHSVTAAKLWTDSTADILSDLMAWRDTYLGTNGVDPGTLVVSRRIWNLMLRNASVRNQVFPGANQPSIVTQNSLNEMLAAQGLPSIALYQAQVNVNGAAQKVLPDNVVLYLPSAVAGDAPEDTQLGATIWGTTAEALDPRFGLTGDEPGVVGGVYAEEDPISIWTKAAAIALPVLANPNLSFKAVVA